jgi:8-oxo-dGTP diphosphatase
MPTFRINNRNELEISFKWKPSESIRNDLKKNGFWWNTTHKYWYAKVTPERLALVQRLCSGTAITPALVVEKPIKKYSKDYALKVKIKDIVNADKAHLEGWEKVLKDHVNEIMSEDNVTHSGNSVSKSQESVWMNCFKFIAENWKEWREIEEKKNLKDLPEIEEYELVFEYSLPGTVHERPDVLLLTNNKEISLEFKRKAAPQIDNNKDDVAQAIRYKEWLENHHEVTKKYNMEVKSYLVCTNRNAKKGSLRGIDILTSANFYKVLAGELKGEKQCEFSNEWLASSKTEMPDMLQAMEIMYHEGRIPYISDVNKNCLSKVIQYIDVTKKKKKKILILINGVPGAGKTAVGQSIVYEENKNGKANAVYLSGNGPLVEVLKYQINRVGNNKHMAENAIQAMKDFKSTYFQRNDVPEQSILIFDEAQRAWDAEKLNNRFSEPEGLFRVGERIYKERGYVVLIGLYGDGQVIYTGEETGLPLWTDALDKHKDWIVIASKDVADQIKGIEGIEKRKIVDNDMFLPVSLRADFIDCSKWVEQAICTSNATAKQVKAELEKLQKTSMRICVTRDFAKVQARTAEIDTDHPEWKYGILVSNFAENNVIRKALPGWNIGYKGRNSVSTNEYGRWFAGDCKELNKACSVYGNQGLELDCPIVLFGGEYVRNNGKWIARGSEGSTYSKDVEKGKYKNPNAIVENNFRVLLTRARKEMILLIPNDPLLHETYQYFIDMGMDTL